MFQVSVMSLFNRMYLLIVDTFCKYIYIIFIIILIIIIILSCYSHQGIVYYKITDAGWRNQKPMYTNSDTEEVFTEYRKHCSYIMDAVIMDYLLDKNATAIIHNKY